MVQLLRWTQRNGTVVEVDSMGLKGAIERLLRRRNAEDPDKGVERKKHGGNHHHHPRGGQDDIGSDGNSSEKRSKKEGGRRCRDKDEQCGGQLDKEQERNWTGLYKLCHPAILDGRTWSKTILQPAGTNLFTRCIYYAGRKDNKVY